MIKISDPGVEEEKTTEVTKHVYGPWATPANIIYLGGMSIEQ
jgi:hypothetical protein